MITVLIASFFFLVGGILGLIAGHDLGWHARDLRMAAMKEKIAEQQCCLNVMKLDRTMMKEQEYTK